MRAHALLSASSAYRWSVCTKSARLEEQYKDSSSWPAREGTIAHALAEFCLLNGTDPDDVTEAEVPEINELIEHCEQEGDDWQEELKAMRRYVRGYIEYVLAIAGERFFEQRVDFSHLVPEGFGTSDAIILDNKTVHVGDLKYGKGKKVFADGPQTKLYALGALNDYGFIFDGVEKVVLHIYQPRLDHVDTHEMTLAKLIEWGEWIKGQAALAYAGDGVFEAGDHCDFCRARKDCRARKEANMRMVDQEFGEPCPSPDRLTLEEIASLLPRLDQVATWCSEVKEFAMEQALAGTPVPGYKLVEGRSVRKWTDELAVAEAMRTEGLSNDQIYSMKLIGMTEAEKLLGKKSPVFELAVKAPGKPTLVPATDKRPELSRETADSDFA